MKTVIKRYGDTFVLYIDEGDGRGLRQVLRMDEVSFSFMRFELHEAWREWERSDEYKRREVERREYWRQLRGSVGKK